MYRTRDEIVKEISKAEANIRIYETAMLFHPEKTDFYMKWLNFEKDFLAHYENKLLNLES